MYKTPKKTSRVITKIRENTYEYNKTSNIDVWMHVWKASRYTGVSRQLPNEIFLKAYDFPVFPT